ncbi:MAG TPA: hypothetical protein VES20_25645 [Bryobacteraceae bacterium]|nr:hypothetical protein [Bryobacteraceae bacterium]
MIDGALGVVSFDHRAPLIDQPAPNETILSILALQFKLDQNEYAEVAVTLTATGPFGWGFWVMSGNASILGPGGGTVKATFQNTYTFKAILRGNATGPVTLQLHTQTSDRPLCTMSDGLLLVKVIGRES